MDKSLFRSRNWHAAWYLSRSQHTPPPTTPYNIREEVRASSYVVVDKAVRRLLLTEVFDRVGPENVAHETLRRGLAEPVNLSVWRMMSWGLVSSKQETDAADVFQGMEFGREAPMDTEELLVHDCGERQGAK